MEHCQIKQYNDWKFLPNVLSFFLLIDRSMDRKSQYSSGTVQSKQNINQSENNSEQTVWLDPDIPNFSKWMLERRPLPLLGIKVSLLPFPGNERKQGHICRLLNVWFISRNMDPQFYSAVSTKIVPFNSGEL